jgi:hypothetical protein
MTLIGCTFKQVIERQSHSSGPKRNRLSHHVEKIIWNNLNATIIRI